MGSWRQLAALPAARYQAAACWHDGKVYLAGGQLAFDGAFQNTLYIYDPTGNTWTTGAVLPATGLAYAFSATDGLHLVFPGTGAHYLYDPETNTWATATTAPVVARITAHHFVDDAGRFYLAGGQSSTSGSVTSVHRYDPATGLWTARADMPSAIAAEAATVSPGVLGADNKVYLATGTNTDTLAVYDPVGDTWTTTPVMPDTETPVRVNVSRLPSGVVITLPHVNFGGPSSATELMARIDGYYTATGTWSMGVTPDYPGSAVEASVATEPGGQVFLLGGLVGDTITVTAQAWAYKQNEPPTVATLLTMIDGVVVSTAATNRARHQFNDPNIGDSQSKFDYRLRPVGSPTWTITGTQAWPNPWHDIPPGTFTPGPWERQVLTYDAAGEPAPAWTPSGLFTAADPPAGPSITYPINGQTLDQAERVDWSTPAQESYQVRRVADDGSGNPNTAVVYFDTGEIVDTLTRTLPLDFATNNRTEHVQVRVKDGGVWSDWDSVSGDVSYTRPPNPTFTPYPDASDASLLIMITNPDPGVGEPAAAYNDVYITDPDPNTGIVGKRRHATQEPTNSPWRYRTPVGSWDYSGDRIEVIAVAANGTTSSSS